MASELLLFRLGASILNGIVIRPHLELYIRQVLA